MSAPSPSEPTGSLIGMAGVRPGYHRVRYEGPLELLGAVTKTFRDAGVTLASVCVDEPPSAARPVQLPGDCRAALALLCQGSLQSVTALVDQFTEEFAPRAGLTLFG